MFGSVIFFFVVGNFLSEFFFFPDVRQKHFPLCLHTGFSLCLSSVFDYKIRYSIKDDLKMITIKHCPNSTFPQFLR